MSLSEKVKRLNQTGWKYAVAIAFNRIVPEWLFRCRRYVVYQLAIPEAESECWSNDSGFNETIICRRCTAESEIHAVEELTQFRRELTAGVLIAYVVEQNGQLVGAIWAATQTFDEPELGTKFQLTEGQAWLFAAMIPKHLRRLGFYSKLLSFVTIDLAGQGWTQQFVAVNPDNVGSNRVHCDRSQAGAIGKVIALRIGKTGWCWTTGRVTRDHAVSSNVRTRPISLRISGN